MFVYTNIELLNGQVQSNNCEWFEFKGIIYFTIFFLFSYFTVLRTEYFGGIN